jgi:serine/threonine-protein kinase
MSGVRPSLVPVTPDTLECATADTLECLEPTLPRDGSSRSAPAETIRAAIQIGTVIGGTYRVIGELGRGAMGVVALAHDERLERKVAIKLIRSDLAGPGFRERFVHEARAMARVNHHNVVQIHAFGEHEGDPYFVMECVNGKTLEEWLRERPEPPDVDVAIRILAGACEGVAAIHAADTLHRDIKPSNILLDADLRPRIADLGVSTFRTAGPKRPEIVGTPAYMAPEVAFPVPSEESSPRADVYSLGCVAYELITGQLPFQAHSENEWVLKHATEEVPVPSSVRPGLPEELDRALLHALEKDPRARTPSAEALRRELLSAREGSVEPVRILVAEDDAEFRDLLEQKLRREFPEAEVDAVANGREALEAFDERPASVAILDLNLPVLDGIELTRLLRERDSSRSVPIVVLTGSGGPREWKQLSRIGADRFLVKPVKLDDVVTLVRHSLRERSSPRSNPALHRGGAGELPPTWRVQER